MNQKQFGCAVAVGGNRNKTIFSFNGTIHPDSKRPIDQFTKFDLQSLTNVLLVSSWFYLNRHDIELRTTRLGRLGHSDFLQNTLLLSLINHTSGLSDEQLDSFHELNWSNVLSLSGHHAIGQAEYADVNYKILGRYIENSNKLKLSKVLEDLNATYHSDFSFLECENPESLNVAGSYKNWGRVDDELDLQLGGCVGCDGLFGSVNDLVQYCSWVLRQKDYAPFIFEHISLSQNNLTNHFLELATGAKALGWEYNSYENRYVKWARQDVVVEKAGGGGAVISINLTTQMFAVILTNYGRPYPFGEAEWNRLVREIGFDSMVQVIAKNII